MIKLGLVDYFLDEFHANEYPAWIKEASKGEVQAVYAYAKIDSPKGGLTTDEWCKRNNIQKVDTIAELVSLSDGIIVLSPDNPEQHEELCKLPLESGKRVYVDKTFAETKEIAKRIFALADANNTPCYSTSALRFAAEYLDLKKEMKDKPENITSWGPGTLETYSIHQVEPIVALMGPDIVRVQYTGPIGAESAGTVGAGSADAASAVAGKWPAFICEYRDGRRASASHHGWECPFGMILDFPDGTSKKLTVESDFFNLFIADMVDFFMTGDVKVPHEETVTVIGVLEAVMKAVKDPGSWVVIS